MTAPAVPRPTTRDMPLLVFTVVIVLCMLATPASREWLWTKFTDATLGTLGWIGADIGPLTN